MRRLVGIKRMQELFIKTEARFDDKKNFVELNLEK
jgi:hypothetical protein